MFKPFKAPTFIAPQLHGPSTSSTLPPAKRQRVGDRDAGEPSIGRPSSRRSNDGRHPLRDVPTPNGNSSSGPSASHGVVSYYNVLWRKYTTKKNKTWDGDGILRVAHGYAYFEDVNGRELGRTACSGPLLPESTLSVGGREIEVESIMKREDYLSGRKFLKLDVPAAPARTETVFVPPPRPNARLKQESQETTREKIQNVPAPKSLATQARYKNPLLESTVMPKVIGNGPSPRHDADAPQALVMKRPSSVPKGKQVVDVVVDPILSKHLREHQREGVRFLYECVMGMRNYAGDGAILADEMGLGKTLQTIAVLWTLLKQNPVYEDAPVIKKAMIVAPATLINNWRKEFRKWLGKERIGVFVYDDSKKRITDFTRGRSYSILVIGYEKLRTNIEELQKGPGIDIVVADEGHRLKTQQNKAGVALRSLATSRRILLSGTPIQNDLSEFFSMVDFVNPGVLGTAKTFVKQFEAPIEKSRQPGASRDDVDKGQARSAEIAETTSEFILRRTVDVSSKYLPPKTEYILLCKPTSAQAAFYKHVLGSTQFQSALGGNDGRLHLQLISMLRKVCNSPKLLKHESIDDPDQLSFVAGILSSMPSRLVTHSADSAKMRVLDQLLHTLRQSTDEKIVLASNFTSTLDLIENLLTSLSLPFLRLDGSVQTKQRQDLVDLFNRTPASTYFAFLISAKAGGAGLNLVGASRLVLFDVDWNPATDAQVLARIHRDGQRRPCIIYRLLLSGALDEKIWQRQVTKLGLADSVMQQKAGTSSFTRAELRDLFRLEDQSACQTHDLIRCPCGGNGISPSAPHTETACTPCDSEGEDSDLASDESVSELLAWPRPVPASRVDMEAQEQQISEQGRVPRASKKAQDSALKMQSLMRYAHIDTSDANGNATHPKEANEEDNGIEDDVGLDLEALIHDDILRSVIRDDACSVNYVFARTEGGEPIP